MSQRTNVVIVGAGPVGLWLAGDLRRRGVDVVVYERLATRSPHSKALTIHPKTLELFAQRGLVDDFLERGIPMPTGHFGALERRLDFAGLETPYPYTLLFPQEATEAILERTAVELGAAIRREHTVRTVVDAGDRVVIGVDGPDGADEIEAAYVVGADGAGSTVRKQADIDFPGTASTAWGFLGDVQFDDPPRDRVVSAATAAGQLLIAPLPGGTWRIAGIDPARQDAAAGELGLDELRASVLSITGRDFGMRDPVWLSRFGNAARQALHYRIGRVLLAGDAAHMHFPAGGVGMNVGIQDAANLGWRLAEVVLGVADDAVLDTYHDERHPVGAELLESTKAQLALMMAFTDDGQALRRLLSTLIGESPELSLSLARRLSGLGVAYAARDEAAHAAVGRSAPDLRTSRGTLFSELADAGARPVLVRFGGADAHADGVVLADSAASDVPAWLSDVDAMLVRPDGYLAWAGTGDGAAEAAMRLRGRG